jgi:hypothetical protein
MLLTLIFEVRIQLLSTALVICSPYAGSTTWTLSNTFAIFSVCFSAVSSSRVIHTIRVLLHDSGIIVVGGMNTITVTSASSITVSITHTPTSINA